MTGWNRLLDIDAHLPSSSPTADQRLRPHLPLTIEQIFIQPPLPPPPAHEPAWRYYEETLEECRALAMRDDRVVLERPDQIPWDFDVEEMEREWLDRINGGDGCWNTSQCYGALDVWSVGPGIQTTFSYFLITFNFQIIQPSSSVRSSGAGSSSAAYVLSLETRVFSPGMSETLLLYENATRPNQKRD